MLRNGSAGATSALYEIVFTGSRNLPRYFLALSAPDPCQGQMGQCDWLNQPPHHDTDDEALRPVWQRVDVDHGHLLVAALASAIHDADRVLVGLARRNRADEVSRSRRGVEQPPYKGVLGASRRALRHEKTSRIAMPVLVHLKNR